MISSAGTTDPHFKDTQIHVKYITEHLKNLNLGRPGKRAGGVWVAAGSCSRTRHSDAGIIGLTVRSVGVTADVLV